jgi:hypothetical protein
MIQLPLSAFLSRRFIWHECAGFEGRAVDVRMLLRIALIVALMSFLAAASADSPARRSEQTETQVIKFFLNPALLEGTDTVEVARRLARYVDDINFIFAKNTDRQFSFDPSTGLIFTSEKPHTDWCCPRSGELPDSGFEIWVDAAGWSSTQGVYASIDSSGAGVVANLHLASICDPDSLADGSLELAMCWNLICTLIHEMEHIYGVAIGEYYTLSVIADSTDVEPLLGIDINDYPDDAYFSTHQDFLTDPCQANVWNRPFAGSPTSHSALVAATRLSDLSAGIIDISMRNYWTRFAYLPDMSRIRVIAKVTGSSETIPHPAVKVWSAKSYPEYNVLLVDSMGNENGEFFFDWGVSNPFSNFDLLRLIKVYKDGFEPAAKYVSTFDAQIAKILRGQDELTVEVSLARSTSILVSQFHAEYRSGGVCLSWDIARVNDVLRLNIYRRGSADSDKILLTELPPRERYYLDTSAAAGEEYQYWLGVVLSEGEVFSTVATVRMPDLTCRLAQNYPNPFNPTTVIRYDIPEKCRVRIDIYDPSGKRIATLVDRDQEKGTYEVEWGGMGDTGNSIASGIYFCRLTAGKETISRKMVLLR